MKKQAIKWGIVVLVLVGLAVAYIFRPVTMSNVRRKPSFTGTVEEVQGKSILVRVNELEDEYKSSDLISVSLDVILEESTTYFEPGDAVRVYYNGEIMESYPAQIHKVYAIFREDNWKIVEEKVMVFSDGKYANLWRADTGGQDIYKLSDGATLLTVENPSGPENYHTGGTDGFDDLSKSVQEAVQRFYQEQGILYDVGTELQCAYEEYLECEKKEKDFQAGYISQTISPTASNEKIVCFVTDVMRPDGEGEHQSERSCTVFDRTTGEVIDTWDLFSVSEEEVVEHILKGQNIHEKTKKEMKENIESEYMIFYQEHLEIVFPKGTLSGSEHEVVVGIEYEELQGIIKEWAIPVSEKI